MLRIHTAVACLFLGSAVAGWAETNNMVVEHPRADQARKASRLWKWSVAALAAGSATDAWSSMGHMEATPWLRGPAGRFTMKGVGIKAAIAGGSVASQWLILRRRPESARAAAVTNFGMAGVFSGVAIRNYRVTHPGGTRQ